MSDLIYESPIEQKLGDLFVPMLAPGATVETQVPVRCAGKGYRLDFVVTAAGKRTGVECDGSDFHEFERDRQRDVAILEHADIDTMIRFRGGDIVFAVGDCLRHLQSWCRPAFGVGENYPGPMDAPLLGIALRHGDCQPIVRLRFPMADLRDVPASLYDSDTTVLLGGSDDYRFGFFQFKSPYWSKRYRGDRAWQIGDYMRYVAWRRLEGEQRRA